ncbi:TcpQ domain-containing protein [Hydrogenophaga sp. 2FB]|uniref:TcpQ domain-containing protein n=1 Tax=Hydrogenophaga sp. 2FB TaxID=2502187 RepID=UPI0010F49715|nr:TcpQ domain-containing protein [Hydrogenophaga sp. 2FB]
MKTRTHTLMAASIALIASTAMAQNVAAVDPAATVDMRLATSKIPSSPAVELSRLKEALSALTVVAIVGESAIMKTERQISGLPRDLTVKSGRTFAILGVPVVPTVLGSSVEFFTPHSSTPVSVSRLGEQGAEVLAAEAFIPESADVVWQIQSGSSIRAAITDWSQRAGWQFVWDLDDREDFQFLAGNRFTGDFRAAVYGLFNSLPLDVKVRAELRPDNTPPMVLITRDEGIR